MVFTILILSHLKDIISNIYYSIFKKPKLE